MWENIQEKDDGLTDSISTRSHRLRVPGGWVVRTITTRISGNAVAAAQTFVEDPDHKWTLE